MLNNYTNFCLGNNRLCCVIFEIMLGKVFSYITLINFPTIMIYLFANSSDESNF